MRWYLSHRADKDALPLADRHYNRQKPGSPQFVPPGKCIVLITEDYDALWVTSWPMADYVQHDWAGAWVNSLFRNESDHLSSKLIKEAISATRFFWDVPNKGLITFIDSNEIKSDNPGYCYKMAGFNHVGYTQGGLDAVQMKANDMPEPQEPNLKCSTCNHKYCKQLRRSITPQLEII